MRGHFDDRSPRPASSRSFRTTFARLSPSSTFAAAAPVVSVCPMTTTSAKGKSLHGLQHLRNERLALPGQCIRLELEIEREVMRRGRQRGQHIP